MGGKAMNNSTHRSLRQDQTLKLSRRGFSIGLLACAGAGLASPLRAETFTPSGKVRIEQVQIAFIGSGNLGGGTLTAGGKSYDFTVGGLGVGGIGLSRMVATGTVYNLTKITDFSGAYVQGRYGLAFGDLSSGELVLGNARGVVLRLKAERKGLALSLGGDAVYIDFD
jgi:hypothetical protein